VTSGVSRFRKMAGLNTSCLSERHPGLFDRSYDNIELPGLNGISLCLCLSTDEDFNQIAREWFSTCEAAQYVCVILSRYFGWHSGHYFLTKLSIIDNT
jgi:hypothetical protein